jgi:predicted nucleic acid-binding protein
MELSASPKKLTHLFSDTPLRIREQYQYHIYDSLMIAAALRASCRTLYSEDMRDGQVIDGLTIRNPFPKTFVA